ncbi:hypothetical protein ACMZ4W_00123 [Brevundimonas naejangsanensis]
MRSMWFGAARGSSSTRMRPLAVSITHRFSGDTVRQSLDWLVACAIAAPASRAVAVASAITDLIFKPDLNPS